MTVPIIVKSGGEKDAKWIVGTDGAGLVQLTGSTSLPPGGTPNEVPYVQFFDDIGDGSGDVNLNVDGSIVSRVFKIKPDPDRDIVITRLIMFLSDSQIQLKRFGFIPQLAVGFEVDLFQAGELIDIILKATTNMNLVQFGAGDFDQFDNIDGSNNDALLVTFTFQTEVRIVAGSLDELQARVNDDLTGLVECTLIGEGKKLKKATT